MAKTLRLGNGVTVICEERAGAGKVAMQVYIKSGSMHEPQAENGLTNLMQEAAQAGTKTRSRDDISEAIEARGGSLSSEALRDGTYYATETLARSAPETFAVIADILRNPVFDAEEIETTKGLIAQGLAQKAQKPSAVASKLLFTAAFSGQPYGNDPAGSPENLAGFTRDQVVEKHRQLLADPSSIIVSFAGDIDAATAEKLVQDAFGDLPAAPAKAAQVKLNFTGGDARVPADNEQLNLFFSFPAPALADADRYAVMLLKEALSGGMSSPLFQEIREKRGLVYSVGAEYSAQDTAGMFSIVAGTGKGNAGELMAVTFDLFGGIIRNGFDVEALEQARERILRKGKDSRETAEDAADANLTQFANFGRLIDPSETEARLRAVTNDDIRRVCAGFLKDGKYALAAVGPMDALPAEADIKAHMKAQLDGVTIPAAPAAAPLLQGTFSGAAQKTDGGTAPQITTLANGMMVITVERPGNLSCGAWVGAGSDHETEALNGATHMNEHMMFKGTPSYPAGSIDRIVEGELGGNLNAYTTRDKTCYYFYSLKPDALEKVVDICGEMVFKADIDHAEFDGRTVSKPDGATAKNKGERDVVIEELRRSNDNVGSRRMDALMQAAYPDQPHGWTILGPEKTLRALTVEQLRAYRDEFYAPNNVIFCAVGPVKHEDFVAIVEQKFGQMPANAFPPLPQPEYKGGTVVDEMPGAKLCNIALAAPAVAKTDPDFYAYLALSNILGHGMSSRLYKEVVLEQELTGSVGAGIMDFRNAGTFLIMASATPENVKPVVDAIYSQIRGATSGITDDELAKAKTAMEMEALSSLESNGDACNEYAVNAQTFGRLVLPADISAEIQKVTVADVERVAQKILAANPTAAMIVPKGTDRSLLPRHEDVVAMRNGGYQPPPPPAPKADQPRL
ncbi:MAG: pitrilysin family protein [Micavibrio sp.]|nr:pitrilysin family protein [Micavibrio sp.]